MKLSIIIRALLVACIVALLLFLRTHKHNFSTRIIANTDNTPARFDNPALAMQYEFERTKDPALGYVPRERLYQAYQYAQSLRKAGNSQTQAAIPGITWTERGPNNVGGRTRAIMVDPNDATKKTIWAGGVDGGLWRTTDITVASPVWVQVSDFFTNMAVTTIAYNSAAPSTMYFGTGEGWGNLDAVRGDGIWKSIDGGTTWAQLAFTASNSNFDFVSKIVVDPATGDVYAATRSRFCNRGGIFKSTDGGTTWTLVLGTQTGACATSFCSGDDIEIAADGSFYAAMGNSNQPDGVYRSTTGNAGTWTKLNTAINGFPTTGIGRIEIACAPSAAGTAYAMVQNSANDMLLNIYKTTNSGTTWTTATLPAWHDQGACGSTSTDMTRTQSWYDLILAIDPANANIFFAGGIDVMKTTNGGTSWTQLSNWAGSCFQLVHADQHAIVFEPGSSSVIYFGNDGGIYRTADGGTTITQKNASYNITQFYSCAIHPATTDYFLTGAQDNGSHKFTASGMNSTTQVTGGDGAFCHIDQDQSAFQFTAYVFNAYFRSTNSGTSWSAQIGFGAGNEGQFINPTDYDNTLNRLYGAWTAGNYFRWDDIQTGSAAAFAVAVAAFGGGTITSVTVSPNTANRVFFGIDNGRVVRVDNANLAGPTSTNITGAGMPAGATVSCIAVETGNDNHILATFSNYGVNSVWETTNGGTTWTSIEGNLPDMPIRWIIFSPNSNTEALVATELGVWSTDLLNGTSTNWGASNTGLANVRVDMLKVRSSDKLIVAATHGRGLFSTTSFAPLPIGLLSFNARAINNAVELTWVTATETNNDYFTIERSSLSPGEGWREVGTVKGAGNSSTTLSYEFTDHLPTTDYGLSTIYYRLTQTDFDGKFSYSNIEAVNIISPPRTINIYPNPANATLSFTISNTEENIPLTITIVDASGKIILSKSKIFSTGIITTALDVSGFRNGTYILHIADKNRNKKAENKFLVQH